MAENVRLGSIPDSARSGGAENESTPPEQRTSKTRSPLGHGPVVLDNGSLAPAAYKTKNKNLREDR
jgi:hypothetical protein